MGNAVSLVALLVALVALFLARREARRAEAAAARAEASRAEAAALADGDDLEALNVALSDDPEGWSPSPALARTLAADPDIPAGWGPPFPPGWGPEAQTAYMAGCSGRCSEGHTYQTGCMADGKWWPEGVPRSEGFNRAFNIHRFGSHPEGPVGWPQEGVDGG